MSDNIAKDKIRLLILLDMLRNETDDVHYLTTEIILNRYLEKGYSCDRRTLYSDIKLLNAYGIGIEKQRIGHQYGYYIVEQQFEISELKIIVDALHAANFISEEQTTELIEKVAKIGGVYRADEVKSIDVQFNTHKHSNKSTFYNVETIAKAIKEKKKIEFLAFDLNSEGNRVYRHHKKPYVEDPISLIHNEDNYYVLVWRKDRGIYSRRIDRLAEVSVSFEDISHEAADKLIEVSNFSNKIFKMYCGTPATVTLEFRENVIGSIYDKFGEQVEIEKKLICHDDKFYNCYQVKVDVEISPTFWGWFNTFAGNMRILSPQWVIDEFNSRKRLENSIVFD